MKREMTNQEYLNQAFTADDDINSAQLELESLFVKLTDCTTHIKEAKGSGINARGGFEALYISCEKQMRECNELVDYYIDIKENIRKSIYELPAGKERSILKYRYINKMTLEKICETLGYANYQSVQRAHDKAVKKIKQKWPDPMQRKSSSAFG